MFQIEHMSTDPGAPAIAAYERMTAAARRLLGAFRLAYLPVLLAYFCYGASAISSIALVFFEKDILKLTPAEVAGIAFWLGLPWSMKMVIGATADAYPLLGSRRRAYLLLGALCSFAGYAMLATFIDTKGAFLMAMLLVTIGFMIQDVIADALSVEVAENERETGQIQTLGRVALLAGGISVGYLGGWLAGVIGTRGVFAASLVLPGLVAASAALVREPPGIINRSEQRAIGGASPRLVILIGMSYAALGIGLESLNVASSQEIVLLISGVLIGFLLWRVGISRAVIVASLVIFLFRATPTVGQGYSYWAIDRLGFDQQFLGVLAQVGSVLSLVGLLAFRKPIVEQPVSFTLFWVVVIGTILYLPSIGLFYGANEWLGVSPRTFAVIDTTISAPLAQLTMVPMLVLIAKSAKPGAEATTFAIMASLMNLALSASELFTGYLNSAFGVTQQDYSNLGALMITVAVLGLLPLTGLPLLRSTEKESRFGDRPTDKTATIAGSTRSTEIG
jgi:hypothetical protein